MLSICYIIFGLICGAQARQLTSNSNAGRFKIYQVQTWSEKDFQELKYLQEQGLVDFWRSPASRKSVADVMVDELRADDGARRFHALLRRANVTWRVVVDDLTKFIDEKESQLPYRGSFNSDDLNKWQRDDTDQRLRNGPGNGNGIRMGEYHSYDEILKFMDRIRMGLPTDTVQLCSIGRSVEGRDIRGIQFGRPAQRTRKVVWIDAGFHAREWTAIHTAVYFIQHIANELAAGADRSTLAQYLELVDVLIFPCLNPDGYEFTRTDPRNPSVRFWRKNRSAERCGFVDGVRDAQHRRCCRGVDLNRNFNFRFAETGTSYFPCSEIFHGDGAFSEPETRAVRDAVLDSDLRGRLEAFVDLHAYSQLWIYPFSHKKFAYPADIDELKSVARRAVTAIGEKFGTQYMYGTGPEIIYAYAGGSTDWAKQSAKIKYTYTIELRPSYLSWNGFVLDRTQLIPTARETFDGIMIVVETIVKNLKRSSPSSQQSRISVNSPVSPQLDETIGQPIVGSSSSGTVVSPSTGPAACEDLVAYCANWLANNAMLCHASRASMYTNCRRSCGFCGV